MSYQKKKILVVDDSRLQRMALKNIINDMDYVSIIEEASNGLDAISQFKLLNPDLTIIDLIMPKMGGILAIEEILKINNDAIILAVTATEEEESLTEALEKGVKEIIQKPYKKDYVLNLIDFYLRTSSQKSVLIVDDSRMSRIFLKKILTKNSYELIYEAENGLEAVNLYKKFKPQLVTMDLDMPVMNGIEAIDEIINFHSEANIVVVSAMEQKHYLTEVKEKGAKVLIKKSFKPNILENDLKPYL